MILSSAQRSARISLAGALAVGLATLSGCGIGSVTTAGVTPLALPTLAGNVHGGVQPISGSLIQLWSVGSTGYGSAGVNLLGANTVTTSADGGFNITGDYTCPTDDTLVYITATGGNPGLAPGTNNPAIKFAGALGTCGSLRDNKPFLWISEVTTAATAFSLGQFFTPTFGSASTDSFGSANNTQSKLGLRNAVATVKSLVNISNGQAITSGTLGTSAVTTTPEAAKLNTIADILAACVNSDGGASSPCQTTLFPSVTPTGATAPTDILQAAVYMSLNPTSANATGSATNLTNLYALQTPTSPYVGLATQPTDWTVGIAYSNATVLGVPLNVAADASGNVWVETTNTGITELGGADNPVVVNALNSSTVGSGTVGAAPRNIAVDMTGNVWVTTSTSAAYIYKYLPASNTFSTYTTSKSSYGIAIDGNNNVFVGSASTSSHFELFEFPGADITKPIQYPIASSTPGTPGVDGTNNFVLPQYMAFDSSNNLWMTSGGQASPSATNAAVQLANIDASACTSQATFPCAVTTSTTKNTYTAYTQGSPAGPFGIAAGANSVWFANSTSGNNTVGTLSLTGATVNSGTAYGSATSLSSPRFVAIDGAGTVWVSDKTSGSPSAISAFSPAGAVLSPVNSGTAPFTVVGFSHAGLASPTSLTIDPSGNVWASNNVAGSTSVFELVGAAAPTVTPLALAISTNKVAQKP